MAPPSICGEPQITHIEKNGSVVLECIVSGADLSKTKWFLGVNEINESDTYKFKNNNEGSNRKKFVCEIKVYLDHLKYIN